MAALAALSLVVAVPQRLGRTWGSTRAERRRRYPGDAAVPQPTWETTHAITLDVPPAQVWPWLVQMGYHRAGWYTYPWVDHVVFHMDNPSADRIVPELQHLAVGDRVPDGPPDTAWYVVDELVPGRHLVLRSTTHLPPAWRDRADLGAWVNWTWTFVLAPIGDGTRLVVRVRAACGPWWLRAAYLALVVPADAVMSRSQLRGIKHRCEAASARPPTGAAPPVVSLRLPG